MEVNPNLAYPELRYAAAEKQQWKCFICNVTMIDRRRCRDLYELPCGPHRHIHTKKQMPRFNLTSHWGGLCGTCSDRRHYGEPHAATFISQDDRIHAAHLSCVISVNSRIRRHGIDETSAITQLRARAGQRATGKLHIDPVDNPPKAQLESATRTPTKAQPPSCTTPEVLHSVEQQSVETQVEAQLARAQCPQCGGAIGAPLHHPYSVDCCGATLTVQEALNLGWTI